MDDIRITSEEEEDYKGAFTFVMMIIKKFMLLPQCCEKIYVIVDLGGKGTRGCSVGMFKKMVTFLGTFFGKMLEQLFIYNYSKPFASQWSHLLETIPVTTANKIIWVAKGNEEILKKELGVEGLEVKYGGNITKIVGTNWPPRYTSTEDRLSDEVMKEKGQKMYSIIGEEKDKAIFSYKNVVGTTTRNAGKRRTFFVSTITYSFFVAVILGILLMVWKK